MPTSQPMRFQRFGRSLHLRIANADDLAAACGLEPAHWVATGAPVGAFNADATFLRLLDTDANGRILCFEVVQAVRWLGKVLRDRDGVAAGSTVLRLEAIDTDDDDGRRVHESASKMLASLDAADAGEISLDQVRRIEHAVEATPVSEAGVVLPAAAQDEQIRQFIGDVVATVGGAPHPAAEPGVDRAHLDDFLAQARAHLDWLARGAIGAGEDATAIMPLGPETPMAFEAYAALKGKIDQYFAQCQAVAFDARAAGRLGISDADLEALDFADPPAIAALIRDAPLARARADGVLDFAEPINPYHASALARLREQVLAPVLGPAAAGALSAGDWGKVKQRFADHEAWLADKAGAAVEPLGPETLSRYLDETYRTAVEALIAESTQTAFVLDNIRLTEKCILYQAHLLDLANNFVSFPHLYDPASRAMFETGSLVMDGRRFNLAVSVENRAAHSAVARTGNMFVLYVQVVPPGDAPTFEVAVPVTSGTKGNLCVGKRGVFEDLAGRELDARVVQVIANPISLGEGCVSPFQRLGRLLSGKIEAMTTSAEKKLDATAGAAVDRAKGAPAPKAAPNRGLMAGGLLMGGGVALAALGSAVAYIGKTLSNVQNYATILIVIGVAILAVVLPTTIVAMVKLRRRDLSAILEGAGWAINARMRLTRRQGRFFTQRPRLPDGADVAGRWWVPVVWLVVLVAVAAAAAWILSRW